MKNSQQLKKSILQLYYNFRPLTNAIPINGKGTIIFPNHIPSEDAKKYHVQIGNSIANLKYTIDTYENLDLAIAAIDINPKFEDELLSKLHPIYFSEEELGIDEKIGIITPLSIRKSHIIDSEMDEKYIAQYSKDEFYISSARFRCTETGLPAIDGSNNVIGMTVGGMRKYMLKNHAHLESEKPLILKGHTINELLKKNKYI